MKHRNLGHFVRSTIACKLDSSPKAAGVATGTGISLSHLNVDISAEIFVRFDISSSLFPNPKDLPSSIEL